MARGVLLDRAEAHMINLATTDSMSEAIKTAAQLAGTAEKIPQGQLGGCVACGHTVASHFHLMESTLRFLGCPEGKAETVFVLVPVEMLLKQGRQAVGGVTVKDRAVSHDVGTRQVVSSSDTAMFARGFRRARYRSALHHKAKAEKLNLSEMRQKVLNAIHAAGKGGLKSSEIMKHTKLPHGSVQQTLHWLRQRRYVIAVEDEE